MQVQNIQVEVRILKNVSDLEHILPENFHVLMQEPLCMHYLVSISQMHPSQLDTQTLYCFLSAELDKYHVL